MPGVDKNQQYSHPCRSESFSKNPQKSVQAERDSGYLATNAR